MDGSNGDEDGGITGHRRGHPADAGLDLAVPVHVGVVEHRVAAAAYRAVLARLALEEDVDQSVPQLPWMRTVGEIVEPGVAYRRPDAVGVESVAHDRVPDAVPPADASHVAHNDDLRAVQLHAGGAGSD